jgi:hypothetical protein
MCIVISFGVFCLKIKVGVAITVIIIATFRHKTSHN